MTCHFGNWLRNEIAKLPMPLNGFAIAIGVSEPTLHRWLKEPSPNIRGFNRGKIAAMLGLPFEHVERVFSAAHPGQSRLSIERKMQGSMSLKPHPFAELLPLMSDGEFSALKTDIERNGQRDKVIVFAGKILDGRNRERAIAELVKEGKKIPNLKHGTPLREVFQGSEAEALDLVVSKSNHRNMSDSQKAMATVRILPEFEKAGISRMKSGGKENLPEGQKGQSRDLAAGLFGISGRMVSDAKFIQEHDPKRAEAVFKGELPVYQAVRQIRGEQRRKVLVKKAKALPPVGDSQIATADCRREMVNLPALSARLIFADPPYNIGKDYGKGKNADLRDAEDYLGEIREVIEESRRVLTPDGSLWLMICDEWAIEFGVLLKTAGLTIRSWIKWYETFGNNCANNFNRTSRHLFYCVKDPGIFVFNHDPFNRPSDRQTKYKDKRASAGGKLWDNVWMIPRLPGNDAEVIPGFTSQLPLDMLNAIVLGASEPGDTVIDPYTGSGTTAVAAVLNGRKFAGYEIDAKRAEAARRRVREAVAAKGRE